MGALALVVALALGQVTNTCGPGKNCTVQRLRVTNGASATTNVCVTGNNADWGWLATTSNFALYSFSAGSNCSTAGTLKLFGNVNDAAIRPNTVNGYFEAIHGFSAPLAFASFPACNAGTAGRLIYDSTNNVWRFCVNALGWMAIQGGAAEVQAIHSPTNVVTGNAIAQWAFSPLLSGAVGTSTSLQAATVLTAGVGAGNITFTVYDNNAAANTTAAVTFACTAAAGTVTTGSTDSTLRAFPNNYQLRVTASACSTNPVVNVTVRNVAY